MLFGVGTSCQLLTFVLEVEGGISGDTHAKIKIFTFL